MGNLKKPELPQFTLGFVIFSIIAVLLISFVVTTLGLPSFAKFIIYIYIGWNLRQFYFGRWQVFQAAALISFNNWLKKGKDDG